MKRTNDEDLEIFLDIIGLKLKYNITEQEFKTNLEHIYKPMTEKERILLDDCYDNIWKRDKLNIKKKN